MLDELGRIVEKQSSDGSILVQTKADYTRLIYLR